MGFLIESIPAILLLTGDDEDPLSHSRLAKAGEVEGRNVAQAGLRDGEQAQVGDVPAFASAGTAGGLAKHHDILGQRLGDAQQQSNAALSVGDDQLPDRVWAKDHRGGRRQKHVQAESRAGSVNALEMLLAGHRAGRAETFGALNFGSGHARCCALR